MFLYYSQYSQHYYMNGKICSWFDVLFEIDRVSSRKIIYKLANSGFKTPVYGYYYNDTNTNRVILKYTDDPNETKPFLAYVAIPAIYQLVKSKYAGYYQYGCNLNVRDIIDDFLESQVHYSKSYPKRVYTTSHTTFNYSDIKHGMLLRYYYNANEIGNYKVRHVNRYKGWKKRYSQVFDWDYGKSASSGWKTHKYRNQWQHNL